MSAGSAAKGLLKRAVKGSLGMVGCLLPRARGCSRILTYHSVGRRRHEMNVTPGAFRAQMEWLRAECRVVTLAEAVKGEEGVAVTFDDGYGDNLVNATPILSELGIPATVFIVAGCMGGLLPHDAGDEAGRLLTWDEALELECFGVSIGAHTMTHRRLSTLSESEQAEEIVGSARAIAEKLGHKVDAFAYPYGTANDYDETSKRLAHEAGFSFALSNRYGVNCPDDNPWELRRIWIDSTDSLKVFRDKVTGRLDALAALDCDAGVRLRRVLNRMLGTS